MTTVKALIRYPDTGKVEECRTGDTLANTAGGGGGSSADAISFAFFLAG